MQGFRYLVHESNHKIGDKQSMHQAMLRIFDLSFLDNLSNQNRGFLYTEGMAKSTH